MMRAWRACLGVALTALLLAPPAVYAAGHALRFNGTGSGDIDRVKIRVDDPATNLPGPSVNVGATDFTIEFWMKTAAGNNAAAVTCGANVSWINGNTVVDRDRFNQDRKFGVSIAGGKLVFGVSGDGTGDRTLCGTTTVTDGVWHHVAVQRRRSDGWMWIFVDGNLDAQVDGPDGDVSYPSNGIPGSFCGGPCTNSDPFLVLGAAKHDIGAASPSYTGWLDELRISSVLRYASNFSRPRAPFLRDAATVTLHHFDEGNGSVVYDSAVAPRGPSHGDARRATPTGYPQWSADTPFNGAPFALGANALQFVAHASGFASPVDIAAPPDGSGRLMIVEQGGLVRIVAAGAVLPQPFLDLTSRTTGGGERGLLSVVFHPGYQANGRLFALYTRNTDGALVVERFDRDPANANQALLASGKVLLTIPHSSAANHNGGKLVFRQDGYLYWSTGDGGSGNDPENNGQSLNSRLGKMLRLNVDVEIAPYYAIPPDNPFATSTCVHRVSGTCPEIWSLGLRNPFRYSVDRLTGDLFIGDVGQSDREEIDFEPSGTPGARNYGWRILEGFICTPGVGSPCTPPANYVPPILDYDHSQGVSVTGGFRYRGERIPALAAVYLYSDFSSRRVWGATVDNSGSWTSTLLLTAPPNISGFGEDANGELYALGYFDGVLYRIVAPDTDGDGLPDWWESLYFGSTTAALAGSDADGDGISNGAEYTAGSDPLNGQSAPIPYTGSNPMFASANGLVCTVGVPCTATIAAAGAPLASIVRSGTLPAGLSFDSSSRVLSGTAAPGTKGVWMQSFVAANGVSPQAVQAFAVLVVASCGGFPDVAGGDIFCANIEWLGNRAVTLGCGAGNYCPNDDVNRASMAAFMNRLGNVLTPALTFVEASSGALDPDGVPVVCATAPLPLATYPREAQVTFAFSGRGAGSMSYRATAVMSLNGGTDWGDLNASAAYGTTGASTWGATSGVGSIWVEAAESVRFAIRIARVAGTADLSDSSCQISVRMRNRNAAAIPHDAKH